jgi:hypothetical protein
MEGSQGYLGTRRAEIGLHNRSTFWALRRSCGHALREDS